MSGVDVEAFGPPGGERADEPAGAAGRALQAWPAALLLGIGAAVYLLAALRWRAAAIGTIDPTCEDRGLVAGSLWLGAMLAAVLQPRVRMLLLSGALTITVVVAAVLAVATLSPRRAAAPLGAVVVLGAVAFAIGGLAGALLTRAGDRAPRMLAIAALGGTVGAAGLARATAMPWFAVLAVGGMLIAAAAAVLPLRATPLRDGAIAYPCAALCAGAVAVVMPWRAVLAMDAVGIAVAGALLLAMVAIGSVPRRHRARAVALAAGTAPWCTGGAVGLLPALVIGALTANCVAAGRERLLRALLAGGVGALLAGVASQFDVAPRAILAASAVASLLPLVRASALAIAALLGSAVALVQVAVTSRVEVAVAVHSQPVELARAGDAVAEFRPAAQDLALVVGGRTVDLAGPDRHHATLLAAFAEWLVPQGGVTVVGIGTGRAVAAFAAVRAAPLFVEPNPEALSLRAALAMDGPVPTRRAASPLRALVGGSREFAATAPPATTTALAFGTPLLGAAASRAAVEEQIALRRAVGEGVVLQPFLLDATPAGELAATLAAMATVHPCCGVFLFGRTGMIVAGGRPLAFAGLEAAYARMAAELRWQLHAAGIASADDFRAGWLGIVPPPPRAVGDDELLGAHFAAGDATACARVVAAALGSGLAPTSVAAARLELQQEDLEQARLAAARERLWRAVQAAPECVLLRREAMAAEFRQAERRIAAVDPAMPAAVAEAAGIAARFCHVGCPTTILQAALGLPDRRGDRLHQPADAGAAALALSPAFAREAPAVLAPIVAGLVARTPLADFAQLPTGPRLIELAVGDGPLAVALRARWPSRCAAALIDEWRRAALPPAHAMALRELADPFVLEQAAAALAVRAAAAELLWIWRKDLPATAAIERLWSAAPAERQSVAVAIAGRTDAGSIELLRRGLLDDELAVRTAAGAALFRSIGDRIVYDPEWPAERRAAAAAQLAALNPRTQR